MQKKIKQNAFQFKWAWLVLLTIGRFPAAQAEVILGAGMSGSWYNPATSGQGVFLDVIPERKQVFMAWFTFAPHAPVNGSAPLIWYTAYGEYNQGFASLDVVKTSGGLFDQVTAVNNELVGYASIQFEDCGQAIMTYELFSPQLEGEFPLQRITPDVYCQSEQETSPETEEKFNLPPQLSDLIVSQDDDVLTVRFDVSDNEKDWVEIKIAAIATNGDRYLVPNSQMTGHRGYPVLPAADQWVRWPYGADPNFMALGWESFTLEVTADDRYASKLQDIVDLVSEERLIHDVSKLQGVRHRSQPVGLQEARNYIKSVMNEFPVTVTEESFTSRGTSGINIIAESTLPSESSNYYIIDGHYDTVATTPGADDNASGTAGMLEAMRVLSQFNSKKGIKFIGFDQEELGLVGSRYHASQVQELNEIAGLINFEMIGYTCRGESECVNFPNADDSIYNIKSSFAQTLSDAFMAVGAAHVPRLKIVAVTDNGDQNFRRSDHAPFWDLGVDALFITDGANFRTPHYHQPSDLLLTLDTEFMTQIVKTAVGTLAKEAGLHHSDFIESEIISIE